MNKILFSILIISLLFLSACTLLDDLFLKVKPPKCSCPGPSAWSDCREMEAIKTRALHDCGKHTDYKCVKYWEKQNCSRERLFNGTLGLQAKISPATDEIVRKIVWVETIAVPVDTDKVGFLFYPEGLVIGPDMPQEDINRLVNFTDYNGKDGWRMLIDTDTFKNGNYFVTVRPTISNAPYDVWLDTATTSIVIKN